jgi:hypothetical protein
VLSKAMKQSLAGDSSRSEGKKKPPAFVSPTGSLTCHLGPYSGPHGSISSRGIPFFVRHVRSTCGLRATFCPQHGVMLHVETRQIKKGF